MTHNETPAITDGNFIPPAVTNIAHGFFGRRGGVSAGLYQSLNCGFGSQDDVDAVTENRARVARAIGAQPENLIGPYQTHSALCHVVDAPWAGEPPAGDAVVTDVPGLALGVLTADCGPVLFYGAKADGAPVIGAAHAGWGGAIGGVLDKTVETMLAKGAAPNSIQAAIGPCIGPASYEVQMDFIGTFLNNDPMNERFFKQSHTGRFFFDLPGYIAARLALAGVRRVSIVGRDTYADEADWFSYRRATHRGEKQYGRQISVIMIRG